ncbi:hypothetical protein FRC07_009700 [Ceratobasidium sp. 392]|nr:hypothetical protein FRC07_009700 [Ceratobasidium sp. 392]
MGDPGPSTREGTSKAEWTATLHKIYSPAAQSKNLFAGSSPGEPLHFHIHSAIPPKLKTELIHLIESHGGKVHKRLIDLHHSFYALVHPGSPRLAEYAAYVSSRDPPTERGTVVPYSFIRASIAARHVLTPAEFQSKPDASHADSNTTRAWAPLALTRGSRRPIHGSRSDERAQNPTRSTGDQLEGDGDGWGELEPVAVHLHVTLAQDERTSLAVKIAKAGGDPTPSMSAARVIVANEDHAEFAQLKKRYEHSVNTYVESPSWIERCLVKGYYFHDPLQKAPMGGRKPGADRNDFTTEDDTRLAQFIAKRIPNKSEGGRTGNNLYKDLCDRTFIHGLRGTPGSPGGTVTAKGKNTLTQSSTITLQSANVPGEYGYSRGKKRTTREDSPTSVFADDARDKRRRSTKEEAIENKRGQNSSTVSTSTNNPRRKRPIPKEPGSSSQERSRTSGTSAQRSNATSARLGHAVEDTADGARGSGGDQIEYNPSAAAARVEPSESAPAMDMFAPDPDANNSNVSGHAPVSGGGLDLSSTYYGYNELDRDVHDKALDLGLSDYLAGGFTSTW